jgi:hypothetical protein
MMMEKLAQAGEGDISTIISTIMCKVGVYVPAEKADTIPLFLLFPCMYSVDYTTYPYMDQESYSHPHACM